MYIIGEVVSADPKEDGEDKEEKKTGSHIFIFMIHRHQLKYIYFNLKVISISHKF